MLALPFVLNCLFNFAVGLVLAKLLGPSEYGRYALVFSIALVLQTLALEWLRLATIRFYSEEDRVSHPEIRSTLDAAFIAIAAVAIVATVGLCAVEPFLPFPKMLGILSIMTAASMGLFELSAALLRARLQHRAYGTFVISKNVLSMVFTVGAAWYFRSASLALVGMFISIAGSFALSYTTLRDRQTSVRIASRGVLHQFAGYGFPIVFATVCYQAVPMLDRALVSHVYDFAVAGKLALAFEIGIKIVSSIGAALDVLLFQTAVSQARTFGMEAGRRQIAKNTGYFLAILTPVVVGCWLVLPSFELLFVPVAFHGSFAHYFSLMMPGILAYNIGTFCIAPVFQLAHRTRPLIFGGVAAFVANAVAIAVLPKTADATSFAVAQTVSSIVGMLTILAFSLRADPIWPSSRDVFGTGAAVVAMIAVVAPLRAMAPGWLALLLQAGLGAVIYGGCIIACDVGGARSFLKQRLDGRLLRSAAEPKPVAGHQPLS